MTKPLLSIITICLDEKNVAATCESIARQTWRDFEWIVIDGGSGKDTLATFEQFAPRIDVFVSEKDEGIYDAMNKGIARASGEWISFMNAGDKFCSPATLQKIFSCLPADDIGLIYGDYLVGNGRLVETPQKLDKNYLFMGNICQQAAFVRAALHEKFLFDCSLEILSDWDFYLRLVISGVKATKTAQPIAIFGENGLSHKSAEKVFRERELLRTKYFTEDERREILKSHSVFLREKAFSALKS